MLKCGACNTEIPEGARFCPSCGMPAGARKDSDTVAVPRAVIERVNQTLADIQSEREAIAARLKTIEEKPDALDEDKVRRMIDDLGKQQALAQAAGERRIEHPVEEFDRATIRDYHIEPSNQEIIQEFQRASDELYVCSRLLNAKPQDLRLYKSRFKPRLEAVQRAMDTTTATEGTEWVPTEFSAQLIEKVKNRLNVARLFDRFKLPTPTFDWPLEGSDATAYLFTEQTADTGQTKFTASTPGTAKIQFSVKGLAARTLWSRMLTEVSIIPIVPYILKKFVRAFAVAQEQACINGDTAVTHQDSDVVAAADARKAWNGLRKEVTSDAKVDLSTLNADNLLNLFNVLDTQYAEDLAELVFLASIPAAIKMLLLRDSQNNLMITTKNQLSEQATIVRGYIGQLFSVPVVNSAYLRKDLNASGVYDGVTTTKTLVLLVYRDGYMFGDYRNYTTQMLKELYAESDQDAAIATARVDFKRMQASTDNLSALGYNIASL